MGYTQLRVQPDALPLDALWGTVWLSNGKTHLCVSTGYSWYNHHPLYETEMLRVTDVQFLHVERFDRIYFDDWNDHTLINDNVDRLGGYITALIGYGFKLYTGSDSVSFVNYIDPNFVKPPILRCRCINAANCVLCCFVSELEKSTVEDAKTELQLKNENIYT